MNVILLRSAHEPPTVLTNIVPVTSGDDSSNSSHESSETLQRKITPQRHLGALTQRARRSGPAVVRKNENVLIWRNITGGKVKQALRNLSHSFRIEAMFLSGELSTHFEVSDISENHSMSPNLILLGCDHEFLGEIRVDIFNAFARISLRSLPEPEDDETDSESGSRDIRETISARSTPSFGEAVEDMLIYDDDSFGNYGPVESVGETSSDEAYETADELPYSQFSHNETWLELISDEQLDPSVIVRTNGTDPFLLSPVSELMDVESE